MTGYTTGDNLPFPNDVNQPADSPNAFQQLAAATQTALNSDQATLNAHTADLATKIEIAPTSALIAPIGANWSNGVTSGYGQPTVYKFGRIVIAQGLMTRTVALTIADNGTYDVGVDPGGLPAHRRHARRCWVVREQRRQPAIHDDPDADRSRRQRADRVECDRDHGRRPVGQFRWHLLDHLMTLHHHE